MPLTRIKTSEDGRYIISSNTTSFINCWDAYNFTLISKSLVHNVKAEYFF